MADASAPLRVNRAPVLTLWAAVVAERLGHPPDTALSLASAVAGTAARAKARRLGISEERDHAKDAAPATPVDTARLLGKSVRLTHDADGVVLADAGGGKPAPAAPVRAYIAKAFGGHLAEVRRAMEALAGRLEPEELNRVGFRLYEQFRPEVPADVKGWGAKGELDLAKIRKAAERQHGAVEVAEKNATLPGVIGEMVQPVIPAVLTARGWPGDPLDNAVRANAGRVANRLETQSPVLQEALRGNRLKVVVVKT